jgi:hypothetical protein
VTSRSIAIGTGAVAGSVGNTDGIAIGTGAFSAGGPAIGVAAKANPSSAAYGDFANANVVGGTNALALGNSANAAVATTAAGASSVAIGGSDAVAGSLGAATAAGATGGVAIGGGNGGFAGAAANSAGSVAIGGSNGALAGATATGVNSVALGTGASTVGLGGIGTNGTALGTGATTNGWVNSTALGQGAANNAANQVMIGAGAGGPLGLAATGPTLQAPGITSAASLAAASNPANAFPDQQTHFTMTDAAGHLATSNFGPSNINDLYNRTNVLALGEAGLQQQVYQLQQGVRRGYEGTAVALATQGSVLPDGKQFAISAHWGEFRGLSAFGGNVQARVNQNVVLDAGVGVGFNYGGVGARAGATYAW